MVGEGGTSFVNSPVFYGFRKPFLFVCGNDGWMNSCGMEMMRGMDWEEGKGGTAGRSLEFFTQTAMTAAAAVST